MSAVRLEGLSLAQAEQAIASVWRVLEAHRFATPQITMTHGSSIDIELSFASPADAETVAEALRSTALAVSIERAS